MLHSCAFAGIDPANAMQIPKTVANDFKAVRLLDRPSKDRSLQFPSHGMCWKVPTYPTRAQEMCKSESCDISQLERVCVCG